MKKNSKVTLIIIVGVIILAIILMNRSPNGSTKETALCIAENSVLYVQLGCHACESQENLFGDNYQYLNIIDCALEPEKCGGITHTPTWIINGEKIADVLMIEELKTLTGC